MKILIIAGILFLVLVVVGMWKAMVFDIDSVDIILMLNEKIDRLEAELEYCRKFHLTKER